MKRILLIALCLVCITGTASAYGLYMDCDESVQAGLPLKCSFDSDFPPGTTFDIVFYQSLTTATEVSRQALTIQDNKLTQYKLLDTKGLPGGNYKIEVQYTSKGEASLRSDSKTMQLVKIIDRSNEITITSPLTQDPDAALRIEGSIAKLGNDGVKIEVRGPDGVLFNNWIGSKATIQSGAGTFSKLVTVTGPGEYEVMFTDAKGYIGTVTFNVVAPATQVITTIPTTTPIPKTTKALTTVPTPWPTATQSPLSPITVLIGIAGTGLAAVFVMKRK
ncbi:MAG: hypothetical protein CVV30_05645 [Methanomicrobiales archaeon HGW-Methanomicrobiales-1]|jgi:hypothetical protein|nr:MAG: hypothetical protein CVV30_05645 [Methanomicrobiales archaeon HGW-Methanomicrobiales-1]